MSHLIGFTELGGHFAVKRKTRKVLPIKVRGEPNLEPSVTRGESGDQTPANGHSDGISRKALSDGISRKARQEWILGLPSVA